MSRPPRARRAPGRPPSRPRPGAWFRRAACAVAIALCAGCTEPEPGGGRVGEVLGPGDDDGFERAVRPARIVFPRDHGAHPSFRSEWWYVTAALADQAGDEFGVQFTLFRQAASPHAGRGPWRTGQVYMAHLAVSDVARRTHHHAERFTRGHPGLAGVVAPLGHAVAVAPPERPGFAAWIEGWRMRSTGRSFLPLEIDASTPEMSVRLGVEQTRDIVLQGDAGFSSKGAGNASYYYSIPRLAVSGTVTVAGTEHSVAGLGWLDREWSTSVLAPDYAGWDWFALQLDDGRDFMLYRLRRRDGQPDPNNGGTLVTAAGYERLDPATLRFEPQRTWRGWPVRWRLGAGEQTLVVAAAFEDQVMDTFVRYWEGLVRVEDETGRRIGVGYMEMTGY